MHVEDPRVGRTRQLVLDHVRTLLRSEGAHAVTPQRVASATGVSRSTLHRHWPDTRSLLLDAVAEPDPVDETPLLGDLRLDLVVDLHQLRLKLNDRETVAIILSMLGESLADDGFGNALRVHARARLDRLSRVLAEGQAAGTLRDDIDVGIASASLAGPLFFRRLVLGEEITPEFVEAVVDGFIAAHART